MNLLAGLINEHLTAEAALIAERKAQKAAEDAKRDAIRREALDRLTNMGPLTAYEMAELLDGSEIYVSQSGYQHTVSVVCKGGFELIIRRAENPQRPSNVGWEPARLYYGDPEWPNRSVEWFTDYNRKAVAKFIAERMAPAAGGA